jgi:hypothetical protein
MGSFLESPAPRLGLMPIMRPLPIYKAAFAWLALVLAMMMIVVVNWLAFR